jgi:hypothetical protein
MPLRHLRRKKGVAMLIRFLLAVALVLALVWAGVRLARKTENAASTQPAVAEVQVYSATA